MPPLSQLHPTAFVTGASGGLGRAFAEMLLEEGVRVWGTARDVQRLAPLSERKEFIPVAFDLADRASALRAWESACTEAGGFAVLINNAGYGYFGAFNEHPFDAWHAQVDAMLGTTLAVTHAAVRAMLGQSRGVIVNVSSLAAEFPLPYMSGYNVVKAGLAAFSESLMVETAGTGLTVVDFRPGDFRTGFNTAMSSSSVTAPSSPRLARAWQTLEANLLAAPPPARAARDLRRVLAAPRSGVVRSGSFVQARLAPLLARMAPLALRRAVASRYFGVA